MLRWSGEHLASTSGVSLSSVRRVEAAIGVPEAQTLRTVLAIQKTLEEAGIEFTGSPTENPGVRLKTKPAD